jgi:hypothetical protein
MYSIVDFYANLDCHDDATDITRQDVDLLQWNIKETEVIMKAITEAMPVCMPSAGTTDTLTLLLVRD